MIIVISIGLFFLGSIAFIINSNNMKEEQEYVDNFKFMISDHEDKKEYNKILNQVSDNKKILDDYIYSFILKYLSKNEIYTMLPSGGLIDKKQKINFFIVYFIIFMICLFFVYSMSGDKFLIALPVFFVVYNIMIKMYFNIFFIKAERRRIKSNFTYFLDLLSTATKSGMTVELGLIAVSEYIGNMSPSLGGYIKIYSADISNNGFAIASQNLRDNIDLPEIKDFTAVLENAVESGAAVTDSLRVLSKETRDFHFIETEEQIGKINAKMGVPLIIFIMFPIIVEIIAPGVLNLVSKL